MVWTHKNYLTKLIPAFGHIGIVDTDNTIHDFSRNYGVTQDNFGLYHEPQKFIRLHLLGVNIEDYNKAIEDADSQFRTKRKIMAWNTSYGHVATVLNNLNYQGNSNHT